MAYSTLADILKAKEEEIIIQLAGTDDAPPVVDTAKVNEAITHADSKIDAYIRKKYSVPLASPDDIINTLSVQLAICWLYGRTHAKPEDVKEDCDKAILTLKDINEGVIILSTAAPGQEVSVIASYMDGTDDSVFDMDTLEKP